MSDRVPNEKLPTLEERMDDVRAVMDAVASERAAVFGFSEGGNMSALFAATYPERTTGLIMFGTFAKRIWSSDYPWAPRLADRENSYDAIERDWGEMDLTHYIPSKAKDPIFTERLSTYFRRSASPGAAVALLRMNTQIDIRSVLPAIRVPTLVLHRTGDHEANLEESRWIASQIPAARFVEHFPWVGDQDAVLDEIEEFLTGERPAFEPDRVLATVLFTDIVGSTQRAASMSDRTWLELLEQHHTLVRRELARFRGKEIKTAGDGFVATFDGPARAVRCASAIRDGVQHLGLEIRAGLHTGEIELTGKDIAGIAVHLAARVCTSAGPSEVVVYSTVRNLVAGSGLNFIDRGRQTLKGMPDEWRLFLAG